MSKKSKSKEPAIETLSEDLEYAELNMLKEDVFHLKELNRELREEVAQRTKESGVIRAMTEVLKSNPITSSFKPYAKVSKKIAGKIEESAVLLLSDLHGDQIILPGRVNNLEDYNFEVFSKRMERLVDTTITHLIDNMNGYSFKTLYVFSIGDMCSGEIHSATAHTKWKNSIKNAVGIGEVLGMALGDLSAYFEKIVCVSLPGNHGRRSIKKDYRAPHDNWDYLVAVQAQNKCRTLVEQGKIEFITPESYSAVVNVEGYNFHLSHGDDLKSFNGIPFYGMERKSRRLTAIGAVTGQQIQYFCIGHYHTAASIQTSNGEFLMNGSFPATDEYAIESLGAYSEPFQLLFGVHPKYGKTWSMPIHLRSHNWKVDEKKPSRYQVTII